MRFVILHYHLFKNAGSTFEDILDHSFGGRFGKLETSDDGGLISGPDLVKYLDAHPDVQAFSSHQIRYPVPQAPGYLFFDICFLRDPLDRLRSFYDYFRQRPNPADPISDLANRSTLGDFVAGMIREQSLFVRNNQVNLLACGGDSDEPDERDLAVAIRRMRECSFPGVVDCFGQSVKAGAAALRQAFPELDCVRPAVNVSRGMQGTLEDRIAELREACRPEVYEKLLRLTALDRRLVEAARAEVLRRYALVRPPVVRNTTWRPRPVHRLGFAAKASCWRQLIAWRGLQPEQLFDAAFYLRKYPDVAASRIDPLCHYLKRGRIERRQPHPLFDPAFYLDRNPDVRLLNIDPLLHYLKNGAAEDRKPHPLFDPRYYRKTCGKTISPGENPLLHFLDSGAAARSPHSLFDCDAYLASHPEVNKQGMNPLVHYLESATPNPASTIEIDDVVVNAEPQQLPFLRSVSGELAVKLMLPRGD